MCQKAIKLVLQQSGVWCIGLLSIIRAQASLGIGNVTEVVHDSAADGDEDIVSDDGVCAFLGTFTEGSVKISPIFRGYFIRFGFLE